MDVVKAVETYISKMVSVPSAMKVLLLDSHTVRLYMADNIPHALTASSDSHSVPCLYAVHPPLAPSLSHRPHRQQQARAHGAHEVRMLSAERRRQPRSPRG